jgi:outer membrane receptor protein involved in Fe transport
MRLTLLFLLSTAMPVAALQAQTKPPAAPDTGEIIVTAQRQSQAISKVPISISAFSQKTLDQKGIKNFADVARFTPGVTFNTGGAGGNANSISIRGISSDGGAGTTGIYIDDTPVQIRGLGFSSDDTLPAIFDLERVEVLRGPQGTLFGAGSEGGTVRYITPQPSLDHISTYDRAEVATTQGGGPSWEVGSAFGAPIYQDKLGFRVSVYHRHDGGYIDHVNEFTGAVDDKNINSGDVTVVRAAVAWVSVDGLKITPSVQYQRRQTRASDNFFVGLSDPSAGVFRTSTPEYRGQRDRFVLPTLNIHYDFGGGISLISNSSYFKRTNQTGYSGTLYNLSYYQSCYLDGCGFQFDPEGNPVGVNGSTDDNPGPLYPFLTPTGINPDLPYYQAKSLVTNTQRVFTQEVRLQSDPSARLNWVVGAFYQRTKQRSTEELIDPQGDSFFQQVFGEGIADFFGWPLYQNGSKTDSYINNNNAIDKQIAGFVNVTYAITHQLKIIAGGRYAKTDFSVVNFADGSQNGGRSEGAGKTSDTPFTPKLGVNFQADRNNLFYFSWSKGFRAAGANPPVPVDPCQDDLDALGLPNGAPTTYKSDRVTSYELGSKNKLFVNRLTIEASVYQIDWDNIQQIVNLPECAIRFIGNLGKARSRGFDLAATISPVHGITIDAAIGYNHSRFTDDATLAPGGQIVVTKGDAIAGAPWTVSVGGQYDFTLWKRDFYIRGDVEYKSRLKAQTTEMDPASESYDPALIAPAANTFVSLRAGAQVGDANISVFCDNLLDSAPQLGYTHQDSSTLLFENSTFRPRTVGLTITYRK